MKWIKLKIALLGLWSFGHSLLAQDHKKIEDLYDQFLVLEFEQADSAFTLLQEGLQLAKSQQNKELIGLGYKYMSWYYQDIDELSVSLKYADSCIQIGEQINDKESLVDAYNQMGNLLSDQALLDSSLFWYQKGLNLSKSLNDIQGVAKVSNNMALAFVDQGEYLKAIDHYHLSIEMSEKIGDTQSVGDAYNNLGTLFVQIEDFEQALDYHEKAFEIRKSTGDPVGMSSVQLNIGRIYLARKQFGVARDYFFKSLAIDQEIKDLGGIALNYNNIGLSYFREGILDSAIYYYEASLKIRIEIGDPFGQALTYTNIGEYYLEQGKPDKAIENCSSSYQIANSKDIPYEKLASCECLYQAYQEKKNFSLAYKFLKEAVEIEASLNSEENNKAMTKKEMQFVFHYQALEDSLKQAEIMAQKEAEAQFLIKTAELEKDKIATEKNNQLWLFSLIGFFIAVIGIIIYVQLRRQKTVNKLIQEQKEFIQYQKHEIEQSIAYAQEIQDTSLPSKSIQSLFRDTLLIYLPRDVVSGDFYWLEDDEEYVYFAAADCTGHGIPGAFISMMGTILLNEIYNSKELRKPGEILDELNRLVQLTLMSRTGKQMKDGMDISFCRLNKQSAILEYAGANNPVWIISGSDQIKVNGEMIAPNLVGESNLFEVKADKQPIGKYADESRSFKTNTIQLSENDQVYLFSDGFADQFGGEKGKKFKYKPFKELLIRTSKLSGEDQRKHIIQVFEAWKGDYDQIDDVCVLGIRV
ncbi:tetratricopeptide repeat protein [Parvicella tangerina]|uniref:PPM-type phosphatase domain-containing protein n=1 Tax=Parvicella tangerina TaxID=2829795 RepID=A0A916JIS9_9FLAO|nr:tetratricopeptide repeat protein [Parvicella tangerina]CAG5076269.1 hypothetical protein CRYO30217_00023 [Parvicella tangerina]